MYKTFAILIALLALGAFSAAQAGSTDQGSKTGTSDQGTHTKKSTKSSGSTLTGCLSGPNSEGAYELKSGKKTVEVGGNDELSKHVGHEVKLHGSWAKSGSEIGEKEEAKKGDEKAEEKGEKHFKVASIDHVSDTCPAAGASKKKGAGDTGGTTPK